LTFIEHVVGYPAAVEAKYVAEEITRGPAT
jgi:hypothetical protein